MISESTYIEEMRTGILNAFDTMATRHPDVEIYTISIWTDDAARKSAVSFDTFENSGTKCRAANESRRQMREQFASAGIGAKVPNDMNRNNNPADFKFQKVAVIDNASLTAQASFDDQAWEVLTRLLDEVKHWAAREATRLNLHADAEIGVNGPRTWYGSVVKIPRI